MLNKERFKGLRNLLENNEINIFEYGFLLYLFQVEDSPFTFKEFLKTTGLSKNTLTKYIQKFSRKGLIQKEKNEIKVLWPPNPKFWENFHIYTSVSSTSITRYNKLIKIIINDINKVSGKRFTTKNRKVKEFIKARLKEGFTVKDFKKVHRNKLPWLSDKKMKEYYRPLTLYRPSHFDQYLNESLKTKPDDGYDYESEDYREAVRKSQRKLEKELRDMGELE